MPRMIQPTEHQVQAQIVDALRLAGLRVHETTAYRQKGPSGVDKGVPDLLIVHPVLPFHYIGLEVKRPGGSIRFSSAEQKAAFERHEFLVVQSAFEAVSGILAILTTDYPDKVDVLSRLENVMKGIRPSERTVPIYELQRGLG